MWNNFCAVVEDLFWFALGAEHKNQICVYGDMVPTPQLLSSGRTMSVSSPVGNAPMYLASPHIPTLLPQGTPAVSVTAHSTPVIHLPSAQTAGESKMVEAAATDAKTAAILHAPVVMYVSAIDGTACVQSPQMDFDAVIETLPYGTAVTVIGYQGRYASVNRSNITGWVNKDDITPQKSDVWPVFVSGHTYDALHVDTGKTRTLIKDVFAAGLLSLPLQAGEYISVRLASEHRFIAWSRKRPRVAGRWATLLKGFTGIHIGVSPKTDSVMEWQEGDGEGRLGYVEGVAPDLTVTVSAIGIEEAGLYTVKTMTEEVWRELRPVFIEIA